MCVSLLFGEPYELNELNELNEPYEPDIRPLTTSPELDNLIKVI